MRLLIISPMFVPATGGAATYYSILSQLLIESGVVRSIIILTEKYPGLPRMEKLFAGRLLVLRLFPFRCGNNRQLILQYFKYIVQNLQYRLVPQLIDEFAIDAVIIHSSFHNFFNLMYPTLKGIAKRKNLRLIADVRDWQLSSKRLFELGIYERIIACSENVLRRLIMCKELRDRVLEIPVIQENLFVSDEIKADKLRKHGLIEGQYLLYSGLIKEAKGVFLLLDAFKLLRKSEPDVSLVLAGTNKENSRRFFAYLREPSIKYLGSLPRNDILALMAGARLNINLSPCEGMPRTSLEALALGKKVALPPNIPEFVRYCPNFVITSTDPHQVSEDLLSIMNNTQRAHYPIERHSPERVLRLYEKVLKG